MRTYSFTLAGARYAYLLKIERVDETVIRLTGYNKALTIGSETFSPEPGLEIGDYTLTNNGEVPNLTFKVAMRDDGPFPFEEVSDGLFDRALATLYITDARNPSLDDPEVYGKLDGKVQFDNAGNVSFELLNKLNLVRDIDGRKYSIEDDVEFGDPRRNKIPTFPTVDATSDDLADVERSTAYVLGERRRFRYDTDDDPSDYHDVYWEVTTAGTTGGSAPGSPSDTVGATVTDGGVTWTVRDGYARAFQVASIIDETHITITSWVDSRASGDTTWWAPGFVWMRTGYMKGFQSEVDAWDGTSQITLVVPFGEKLTVGDWGEITPGYDQTLDMAVDKYGAALTSLTEPNSADGGAYNYRGWPHITGTRFFTSQYIPGVSVDSAPDADDPGAGEGGGGGGGGGGYGAYAVEFLGGSS